MSYLFALKSFSKHEFTAQTEQTADFPVGLVEIIESGGFQKMAAD